VSHRAATGSARRHTVPVAPHRQAGGRGGRESDGGL